MRWFSAACVVTAFLSLPACAPSLDDTDQFVCAGTCTDTLDKAAFWCTTKANLNTFSRPKVELAFKSCLAEYGYVNRSFLALQTAPTQPKRSTTAKKPKRSVVKKKPKRSTTAKRPKRSAVKKKPKSSVVKKNPKQNAAKKKPPAKSQPSQPLPSEPEEFDPKDLFEKPPEPS